jgi:hypothetical protein
MVGGLPMTLPSAMHGRLKLLNVLQRLKSSTVAAESVGTRGRGPFVRRP